MHKAIEYLKLLSAILHQIQVIQNHYIHFLIQMKKIRKELNFLVLFTQAILQHRMDANRTVEPHLKTVRSELRKMIEHNEYNEGILSMLVKKQSFKVRESLNKSLLKQSDTVGQDNMVFMEICFSAIQKSSGQLYNSELWCFCLSSSDYTLDEERGAENMGKSIVHFLNHMLSLLFCYPVFPTSSNQQNKYLTNYEISIRQEKPKNHHIFSNTSSQKICIPAVNCSHCLESQFYYNQEVINNEIKQIQTNKFKLEALGANKAFTYTFVRSKKYSDETIDSNGTNTAGKSISQFYDEDLDMTILSMNDCSDDQKDEKADKRGQESQDDKFQMLLFEQEQEDHFLRDTQKICQQIMGLEKQYF